jgi:hypothetical protein
MIIGLNVGYKKPSHFAQVFRRVVGARLRSFGVRCKRAEASSSTSPRGSRRGTGADSSYYLIHRIVNELAAKFG